MNAPKTLLVSAILAVWVTSVRADPILPAPPPPPTTGAIVYSGGTILQNNSASPAHDVRIGFRIPGLFGENINQLALALGGPAGAGTQSINLGNQFSQSFDEHFVFTNFEIQPNELLQISALIDSRKTNGLKWLRNMTLTGVGQVPIDTLIFAGGFTAVEESPLTYTFSNDGNTILFVDQIALGRSPALLDPQTFLLGMLEDLLLLNNNGQGWTLSPDEEISFVVPFSVPAGTFLISDVVGSGTPLGALRVANSTPLHYVQQHEVIPEPSTLLLFGTGLAAISAVARRRSRRKRESTLRLATELSSKVVD